MSLDLSNKSGRAHNGTVFAAADFSGLTATNFNSGDIATAGKLLLQVNLTANGMNAATLPITMKIGAEEILVDGFELTIIKTDATSNSLTSSLIPLLAQTVG